MLRPILVGIAALAISSPALYAQTDSSIAVGVALTFTQPSDRQASMPTGIGLVGRLRRGSGLGATVGLEWFKANVQTEVGGQPVSLGTMNVRPFMAGASYMRQYRRFAVSGALVAGYAFTTLRRTDAARSAYADRLGVPDASFHVSNCLAARPDVTVWYELGRHFGVSASMGYMWARPTVTTTSRLGTRAEAVNLSGTLVTFAIVYGIF